MGVQTFKPRLLAGREALGRQTRPLFLAAAATAVKPKSFLESVEDRDNLSAKGKAGMHDLVI